MFLDRIRHWWRRWRAPQLPEALSASMRTLSRRFEAGGVPHALIGGMAMSLHGPPRATRDLDFLIAAGAADAAHSIMTQIGFETLQRSKLFAHYLLPSLRVDFLYTQGARTARMIERAVAIEVDGFTMKIVGPEDLIGLKLQALANAPERGRDVIDVRTLVDHFHERMDMALVRDYFVLFNMSSTIFSRLSPDEVAELRANAANPEFREMNKFTAPCGATPAENFRMTLALIRELEPFYRNLPQDRSVPVVKSFIL